MVVEKWTGNMAELRRPTLKKILNFRNSATFYLLGHPPEIFAFFLNEQLFKSAVLCGHLRLYVQYKFFLSSLT
jgi:hypothetical protein